MRLTMGIFTIRTKKDNYDNKRIFNLLAFICAESRDEVHIILSIAALSFLGLGAQPPIREWGTMLNEGRPFMETDPHLMIFSGLMIMIMVLAFNFLGDGLRDALDPRMREVMMK